ncbi:MAG: IclR family transcriptional regulator C-terminal domain-containing protein [Pseudolabrys sp.]|nr:IclR family transcriptional regulator C-terminal domain-containing protein [Pseudolabrys sp.]MDP2294320.1 IclR family transcriptional regulator C-terminal domain-containing protein [Pseudolabrys sp.]
MLASPEEIAAWPSGSDTFVESFAKGLAVIGAFGDGGGALTISDVSRLTGLPRAGVRRLLLSLVALALAEEHDGRFSLTPRVLRLGYAYLASLSLREIAQPLIEMLARECDEIVAVSVLDGDELTYVARAEPSSVLRRSLTVGSRLPVFCTSMGRVLLAGLTDDQVRTVLSQSARPAYTRHTITDIAALSRTIATVRSQGWCFVSEELELGACGLAAPIRDGQGRTVAALNISTNLGRHSEKPFIKQFKQRLIGLAEKISSSLPRS